MGLVKDFVVVVLEMWLAMLLYPFVWLVCELSCKVNEGGETCHVCKGW